MASSPLDGPPDGLPAGAPDPDDDDGDDDLRPLLAALAHAPARALTGGAPRLAVGTAVGRYRVTAHLGDGGTSVVYRAIDEELGREVALKLLHGRDTGADRRSRLGREARALAALSHPNIVAIHDVGDHDGTPYLALELLEGETLRERLRRGPLDDAAALDLARQILAALVAAHDRGIVHRDLKPENLFLTAGGPLKVLDFGLAKRLVGLGGLGAAGETPTLAGVLVGTAAYMAPEQLRLGTVDERTDLFAFGAVVHEMATGAIAFAAPTFVDTAQRILHDEPAPLRGPLAAIAARCLAKDPADRYASARDVLAALAAGAAPPRPARPLVPVTRYARSGEVHIGYQTVGDGPTALVIVPGFVSNIEQLWEDADTARQLTALARRVRLVLFDKRGTGLSDRVSEPAVQVLEHRVDDIRVVMDHAGVATAAVLGVSEGAPIGLRFAVTYPERVRSLILYGGYAAFQPSATMNMMASLVKDGWGSGQTLDLFGPSAAGDPAKRRWWAKLERLAASPGAAAQHLEVLAQLDVSAVLGLVRTPTLLLHRTGDRVVPVAASRKLAAHIPGARLLEHPGDDHLMMLGDADRLGEDMLAFVDEIGAGGLAERDAAALVHVEARDREPVVEIAPSAIAAVRAARRAVTGGGRAAIALDIEPRADRAHAALAAAVRRAAAGEVLVTAEVRGLAWDGSLTFDDRGVHSLVDDGPAARLFAVSERDGRDQAQARPSS
jgi:pimeloyl-ACP methyl ester carboxylesterase